MSKYKDWGNIFKNFHDENDPVSRTRDLVQVDIAESLNAIMELLQDYMGRQQK